MVSRASAGADEQHTSMTKLLAPDKHGSNNRVSLDDRNGTNWAFRPSASITMPNADNDDVVAFAASSAMLLTAERDTRSLPAKSTITNRDNGAAFAPAVMVNDATKWERLGGWALALRAAVTRLARAEATRRMTSCGLVTACSDNPGNRTLPSASFTSDNAPPEWRAGCGEENVVPRVAESHGGGGPVAVSCISVEEARRLKSGRRRGGGSSDLSPVLPSRRRDELRGGDGGSAVSGTTAAVAAGGERRAGSKSNTLSWYTSTADNATWNLVESMTARSRTSLNSNPTAGGVMASRVWVLPLPLWPYASTHADTPSTTADTAGRTASNTLAADARGPNTPSTSYDELTAPLTWPSAATTTLLKPSVMAPYAPLAEKGAVATSAAGRTRQNTRAVQSRCGASGDTHAASDGVGVDAAERRRRPLVAAVDELATARSSSFWCRHAMVFNDFSAAFRRRTSITSFDSKAFICSYVSRHRLHRSGDPGGKWLDDDVVGSDSGDTASVGPARNAVEGGDSMCGDSSSWAVDADAVAVVAFGSANAGGVEGGVGSSGGDVNAAAAVEAAAVAAGGGAGGDGASVEPAALATAGATAAAGAAGEDATGTAATSAGNDGGTDAEGAPEPTPGGRWP